MRPFSVTVSSYHDERSRRIHATVSNQIVSLPHLNLGDTDMGPLDFHVVDYAQVTGTDGFIGNDFFATHLVCFDFPGMRLLVRRP